VIAVSVGDEPLYDWDFGDPDTLATYINSMKSTFASKKLSIPVSISELAYGWQQAGDTSSVADAVDFFMINNFPYFSQNAQSGGDSSSWTNFQSDMSYYKSISQGKPLMVAQVRSAFFLSHCLLEPGLMVMPTTDRLALEREPLRPEQQGRRRQRRLRGSILEPPQRPLQRLLQEEQRRVDVARI
jgi:hypothetical protein